ncbi:hypothetical protein BJ742DRAFT_821631 [Cladochytrium replicatum]|nr:hypothetical protein BJ742DRAFT_821631 [Cladochytrium replicatum]
MGMMSEHSANMNRADSLHRAPPPRTASIPSLGSSPFSSAQVPVGPSPPVSHGPGRGVVLLKDSNQLTNTGPPTSYTPLSNSNSTFTGSDALALQQPLYFAMVPPQPPPVDFGKPKRTWFQRYKWLVIVGVILVLAAIIVPTAILVSINSRVRQGDGSGTGSTSPTVSTRSTTATTTKPTQTAAPSAATVYPATLPNGAVLLDPLVRPSNNAALRFNLTGIQDTVSVFSDAGYEYHVVFARSLSTAERTYPNPPYLYNYCSSATVVMCQLQVAGIAANPDAYPAGLLTSSSSTTVTVNGTSGLQMSFAAVASQFCKRQVSIILLCSTSATAKPVFSRLDSTQDNASSTCNYNVYFSHSSGCSISA